MHLTLDPVDTLMFRDGRPFEQTDAGASEALSVFPPWPPTLVGAIRAALWDSLGAWDKARLGDGTDWQKPGTLGPLCFGPPVLVWKGEAVFAAPLHLIEGRKDEQPQLAFLRPGKERECDLGKVRLPEPATGGISGIKPVSDRWITKAGMARVLKGKLPDREHLLPLSELWRDEARVGIGIDPASRTTSDGRLYLARHVRPGADLRLHMTVKGWNGAFPPSPRPLGGEHRMASIGPGEPPDLPSGQPGDRLCLIAISPVVPEQDGRIEGLSPDNIVSACLGKPLPIGGWDSVNRRSIPMRNCYPAGSVWFVEGLEPVPPKIGAATKWGFGRVLAGVWPSGT